MIQRRKRRHAAFETVMEYNWWGNKVTLNHQDNHTWFRSSPRQPFEWNWIGECCRLRNRQTEKESVQIKAINGLFCVPFAISRHVLIPIHPSISNSFFDFTFYSQSDSILKPFPTQHQWMIRAHSISISSKQQQKCNANWQERSNELQRC